MNPYRERRRGATAALLLALLPAAGCSVLGLGAAANDPAEVVFFDDFSGPALDRARWNVEVTGQWVNDEQQAYIDGDEVIHVVTGSEARGAHDGALAVPPKAIGASRQTDH